MTEIKVGDLVTWQRPRDEHTMYMGMTGCVVVELHDSVQDGEETVPGATIKFRGEPAIVRRDYLTKE